MSEDLKKKFTKLSMQAREQALNAATKTMPADRDRIDALEDAVLAISSTAPKETTAQMIKLYENMVKLDKIDLANVPASLKHDIESGTKPKVKPNDIRKEVAL